MRIIKFEVPSAKSNGSSAILHCDYDLEQNELYSVKFYKDYFEFYRFIPRDIPPAQSFNLDGIHLDVSFVLFQNFRNIYFETFHFFLLFIFSKGTTIKCYSCDASSNRSGKFVLFCRFVYKVKTKQQNTEK